MQSDLQQPDAHSIVTTVLAIIYWFLFTASLVSEVEIIQELRTLLKLRNAKKRGHRGSNTGPKDLQSFALPLSYALDLFPFL